jgi:cell wall assembly regulator SMI1
LANFKQTNLTAGLQATANFSPAALKPLVWQHANWIPGLFKGNTGVDENGQEA